jgi:hypothetical protein
MDHIENDGSNNSFIVGCAIVAAVTFLQSRFQTTILTDTQIDEIYL